MTLTRQPDRLPVGKMQTFSVVAPPSTHWRTARCEEVDCANHRQGWASFISETTVDGRRQAHYIRKLSGRYSTEHRTEAGLVKFVFPPGQQCFAEHRVRVPRPELFIVRGGDHRGNPTNEQRRHANGADWVEDMSEQLDALRTIKERG